MSKLMKHLFIVACIAILPTFLAVSTFGDNIPAFTRAPNINPGNGQHPGSGGTVIYSNFSRNYGYNCCMGWTVSGVQSAASLAHSAGNYMVAEEFSSSGSYSVGQINVALGWVAGVQGATVSLWSDNNNLPGTELGSWNISNLPVFGSTDNGVATISGITGINVQAGADYFLELSSPNSGWDAWSFNNIGLKGLVDQGANGVWNQYMSYDMGAFNLLADPTGQDAPEPATLTLLGTGLLALGGLLRRRFFRD